MTTGITQYRIQIGGEFMKMKKMLITSAVLVVGLVVITFAVPKLWLLMGILYEQIFGR
jgi:hypothetical protein